MTHPRLTWHIRILHELFNHSHNLPMSKDNNLFFVDWPQNIQRFRNALCELRETTPHQDRVQIPGRIFANILKLAEADHYMLYHCNRPVTNTKTLEVARFPTATFTCLLIKGAAVWIVLRYGVTIIKSGLNLNLSTNLEAPNIPFSVRGMSDGSDVLKPTLAALSACQIK